MKPRQFFMGIDVGSVSTNILFMDEKDEVVGMVILDDPDSTILVVSENGYGKRSLIEDYRITNRGGKGVKTINVTEKTGNLVAIKSVTDQDDLMIINKSGIAIRMEVDKISVMGRATQGVRLIKVRDDDAIAAVAKVVNEEDEDADETESEVENGTALDTNTNEEQTSNNE